MELRKSLGEDLAAQLKIVENEAKKIWSKGELYHVYYTLHGLDHSNYIIKVLEKLIDGLNPQDNLNETEIFCLLAAAYLHDVGMQRQYSEDIERAKKISERKRKSYYFQDLIRDEHHERSGRYIKDNSKNLKLDHVEAECIRLISEGHREIKLESKEYDDQFIGLESVRVRLLSALLRLADELDIIYKRAPETLFDIFENNIPDYSRLQWLKHYYTSGLNIETHQVKGKNKTSIIIQCQFPIIDVGRKIIEIFIIKPIEDTLNDVRSILLEYGLNIDLDYKIKANKDLNEIPKDIYDKYFGQKLKISMEIPRVKGFIGRNDELKNLLSSLDKNIIIIEGIAGIGKSFVAAKFAEEIKDEYTVFWYENLSEVSTLSSVMNKLSIFLKENDKPKLFNSIEHLGYDNEVLITLLKEELNFNNFAIFFDNYHTAEKELNPLLTQLVSVKSSKIIIITREEPEFYNILDERENRVVKIKIDAWDFTHTKMMLEARGINSTDETLVKIHDILLGHPQYLNLFCVLVERSTAEELLENLPSAVKDAHKYLEKEVYNSLITDEKLLLQTIAIFRTPQTIDAFNCVNKFTNLNETLDSLIHKFLVNEIGINTFSVHDIIRTYSLSDVGRRKILRSYHQGAAEYYLSFDDEPEHILEAAYHFEESGMKEKAAEIVISNAEIFISKGFWDKIENQLKSAINSFRRNTRPHIMHLVARANLRIGEYYEVKGESDLALHHATQSLIFSRKIKDFHQIFYSNNLIASIYLENDKIEEAKKYNKKCMEMAESQEDVYKKAVAMGTCGLLLDDNEQQLELYKKSLKIFQEEVDFLNIYASYSNIAEVYKKMDEFEKSYEFIIKALELQKERQNFFEIARTKISMARIYYSDPKMPVSIDSIIKCLNDEIKTYEKIGHVRGVADVFIFLGDIYFKDKKSFESANEQYQKAAKIYSSLNQKAKETELNLKIGTCFSKLKEWSNAKYYFEKNLNAGNFNIIDKLSLAEFYLISGSYNEAYEILNKTETEENLDNNRVLIPLFSAISLILLNKKEDGYNCLRKMGTTNYQKVTIKWDFSDILPVLDKTGESKQLLIDTITLLKNETKFPIIRLADVKIIKEELGKQAEVFHPFTNSRKIMKDDENLKDIMQKLSFNQEIDIDMSEIMGIERNKALLILGFLYKKGFLDCNKINIQKISLKLSERGMKILRLNKAGS